MPYLGGYRLTGASWVGANAIAVSFETSSTGLLHQLYAGRSLIGVTTHASDREVVGQLVQSAWPLTGDFSERREWPQRMSLVAVEPANRLTDYGAKLGVWPYNAAKIVVSLASLPDDAQRLVVTSGTEPSGAVDGDNILGTAILEGDGDYEILTPPMGPSGTFNFEVTPYDDRLDDGNAGTALTTSLAIVAYPPDVLLNDTDDRLRSVSIANQTLNLSVVLP